MALGWLWWRAWARFSRPGRRDTLRGRRGRSMCMADMALGDIHLRFAWQAWYLWHWAGYGGALGRALAARGATPLRMAGVALGDIGVPCAWQAWHLVTSTFTLRGRRVTYGTGLALLARLGALCRGAPRHFAWQGRRGIDVPFAWQAWHLVTSTFTLVLRWRAWARFCRPGRRAVARQAWHLVTLTFHLRGRRGTW